MKASHASTLALRRCQSTGSPISLTFLQGRSRFVQGTEPSPRAIGPQSEVHGGWITLASLTASQMTLAVSPESVSLGKFNGTLWLVGAKTL